MMTGINSNTISLFAPYYETDNMPFVMKIGGTTYEFSTHFSTKGKETVHNNEKKHSHNNVKVDIYFTAIGLFDVPTEQELLKAVEELKNRKQLTVKSA